MDHPVKIGREAAGHLKFANVFSPALETIAAFFDDLGREAIIDRTDGSRESAMPR